MNRKLTFIATLLMTMAAGRGIAAVATNAVSATNAPAAKETSAVKDMPVKTAAVGSDGKLDFDSFKLVHERNIFDMSRTGRIGVRPAPKRVIVDDFTLVGTMSYEKGQYAFFDGSSSEYRQNLKPGDKIANFKISAIGSDYVDLLATNNNTIRMKLSTAMRREDKGPWSGPTMRNDTILADTSSSSSSNSSSGRDTSDRSDRSSRSDRRRSSRGERSSGGSYTGSGMGDPGPGVASPATDSKADNSASSNESDIVKRLMEKRAQQTKDNP